MPRDPRPTWQLVLQAAEKLTAADLAPFKLDQLIELVQRTDPTRASGSISPVVQGMTVNATGGPPSAGGKTLRRLRPGFYELLSAGSEKPPSALALHSRLRPRDGTVDDRRAAPLPQPARVVSPLVAEQALSAPPGDSAVQRAAEVAILRIAEGTLQTTLQPRRLLLADGIRIEVDGVSDDPPILCEVWAHQGPAKTAQVHKVLHDALKLFVAGSAMQPSPRLVLILSDLAAAKRFHGKTWYAYALATLNVELHVVAIPQELRDEIMQAQLRQYR
jgi:hypothetical protein